VNLRDLLETPHQIRRLASDMVTTVVLFTGEPEPGAELIHACLDSLATSRTPVGSSRTPLASFKNRLTWSALWNPPTGQSTTICATRLSKQKSAPSFGEERHGRKPGRASRDQ
jgi:hypothetical protein